jgi:hypothetical protein
MMDIIGVSKTNNPRLSCSNDIYFKHEFIRWLFNLSPK